MYNSMALSTLTVVYSHFHDLVPELFITPKRNAVSLKACNAFTTSFALYPLELSLAPF